MVKQREHSYERRVRMLREYIDQRIILYRDYLHTGDRPVFYAKLTDSQEMLLYLDPAARAKLSEQKLVVDGPEAHAKWVARMEGKLAALKGGVSNAGPELPTATG